MKWWYWLLAAGAVYFIARPAAAAPGSEGIQTATPPDADTPVGPSLTAYLDAIKQYWTDLGKPPSAVTYNSGDNSITVQYPAGTKADDGTELFEASYPWSWYFNKLFNPGTCSESTPGVCKYSPMSGFGRW